MEFHYQPPGGARQEADWLIAEDITLASPGYIRSMSNPISLGHPDHYSLVRFLGSSFDNGGIHINCGVPNHAFYLAVAGGTNRVSGLRVQGVGLANRERMERIFYRAFVYFLGSSSSFHDARAATIQAAVELYGRRQRGDDRGDRGVDGGRSFLMRGAVRVVLVCATACALPGAASAQARGEAGRGYVGAAIGALLTASTSSAPLIFPAYGESARLEMQASWPADATVEIDGGVRLWRDFGVALTVTRGRRDGESTLSGPIPHPYFFNQPRTLDASGGSLTRTETATAPRADVEAPPDTPRGCRGGGRPLDGQLSVRT